MKSMFGSSSCFQRTLSRPGYTLAVQLLEALQAPVPGSARRPETDDVATMAPPPAARSAGTTEAGRGRDFAALLSKFMQMRRNR